MIDDKDRTERPLVVLELYKVAFRKAHHTLTAIIREDEKLGLAEMYRIPVLQAAVRAIQLNQRKHLKQLGAVLPELQDVRFGGELNQKSWKRF